MNSFLELWKESGTVFPDTGVVYSPDEKQRREDHYHQMKDRFKSLKVKEKINAEFIIETGLMKLLRDFFRLSLDYNDAQLDIIFSDRMISSTFDFLAAARHFDPSLSVESVFQACRNVWIMNGIQFLLDKKISLTPSVFAYSMLYPYSDNLIDDPAITEKEKKDFSERFELRLKNLPVRPAGKTEEKIFRLVGLIENEWDREIWPGVYESLISIHSAQSESVRLLSGGNTLSERNALEICAEKGGASVIADGFLVAGNLDYRQEEFLYIYGAYLQLLDDLQDLREDAENGLNTCFSMEAMKGNIDSYVNKMYNLGRLVVDKMENLKFGNSKHFTGLIEKSINLYITGVVLTGSGFISSDYLIHAEKYFPFTMGYVIRENQELVNQPKYLISTISDLTTGKQRYPEWLQSIVS